jgi:hypothetical protein
LADPIEAITAGAGAIEETAKTAGKAIEAGRDLGSWFEGKAGQAISDAIGLVIGDPLAEARQAAQIRRHERLIILGRQSQARLSALGVEQLIPLEDKVAIPLLEAASLESDPSLQEMWANLLATALSEEDGVGRAHISILADLSPIEARALRDYYLRTPEALKPAYRERGYVIANGSMDGDLYGLHVTRGLFRLGLVEPAFMVFKVVQDVGRSHEDPETNEISVPGDLYRITMTELGEAFCRAVGMTPPEPKVQATTLDI